MKARLISTNKEVDVRRANQSTWIDLNNNQKYFDCDLDFGQALDGWLKYRTHDKITEQDTAPCDLWEQRRWEAAKACLVGIIANARFNINLDIGDKAEQAVNYADALIKELKKRDNE